MVPNLKKAGPKTLRTRSKLRKRGVRQGQWSEKLTRFLPIVLFAGMAASLLTFSQAAPQQQVGTVAISPAGVMCRHTYLISHTDQTNCVREAQHLLNSFSHGPALQEDGRFGPETSAAVVKFRTAEKLFPCHVPVIDATMWSVLYGAPGGDSCSQQDQTTSSTIHPSANETGLGRSQLPFPTAHFRDGSDAVNLTAAHLHQEFYICVAVARKHSGQAASPAEVLLNGSDGSTIYRLDRFTTYGGGSWMVDCTDELVFSEPVTIQLNEPAYYVNVFLGEVERGVGL